MQIGEESELLGEANNPPQIEVVGFFELNQAPAVARRHYVNLDSGSVHAALDKHQHGKYITLHARVRWRDGARGGPLAGQQVRWTFAPEVGNLDNPPGYVPNKATDSKGFSSMGGL